MRELRERFLEYMGDRGPILLQWITDAFAKIVNLQFHELRLMKLLSSWPALSLLRSQY